MGFSNFMTIGKCKIDFFGYLGLEFSFFRRKLDFFSEICAIFIAFRANLCYPIVCESACS